MPDGYADMSRDELIKLITYLTGCLEESDVCRKADNRRMSEMAEKISELTEQLRKSNEVVSAMAGQVSDLMSQLKAEIPQEVLCRNSRRQPRLRKTYALDHRHKCKQIININRILI